MKITDVETFHVRSRFRSPIGRRALKWSGGARKSAYSVIIRLKTDDGIVGLGEAPGPFVSVNKTVIDQELRPLLIGQDPFQSEKVIDKMDLFVAADKYFVFAISGIEMALQDILGKTLGVPLYRLLGGLVNENVAFNGLIFISSPQENAEEAKHYVGLGCKEIKMKVGPNPELDVERMKSIREAVGPNIPIRIDVNQGWSVPTAIKYIKKMERYDLMAAEQPVPTIEGLAEVRRSVDTAIIADESVWTLKDAYELISKRAADIFYIRVEEAGGVTKCKELADFSKAMGIPCIMGSWAEMGVSTAAKLHLVASSTNFPFGNDTHLLLQSEDVIKGGIIPFANGGMKVPTAPGLGVELDEAMLTALTVNENGGTGELFSSEEDSLTTGQRIGAVM